MFHQPNVDVDVAPLPALTNGSVTFGCFNKIERINDDVVAVWARILKAIPDSKLFLKDKKLSNDSMRDAVYRRFEFVGIGRGRLILEGSSPRSEYLASYNRVDIALSPFSLWWWNNERRRAVDGSSGHCKTRQPFSFSFGCKYCP